MCKTYTPYNVLNYREFIHFINQIKTHIRKNLIISQYTSNERLSHILI